jgi:hypothetical protein
MDGPQTSRNPRDGSPLVLLCLNFYVILGSSQCEVLGSRQRDERFRARRHLAHPATRFRSWMACRKQFRSAAPSLEGATPFSGGAADAVSGAAGSGVPGEGSERSTGFADTLGPGRLCGPGACSESWRLRSTLSSGMGATANGNAVCALQGQYRWRRQ